MGKFDLEASLGEVTPKSCRVLACERLRLSASKILTEFQHVSLEERAD